MLEGITVGHLVQAPCSSTVTLEHMAPDCAQMFLEYFHWGRFHNLSKQPVPVLSHLHSIIRHIQVELPVHHLLPIASGPIPWHHWEEPGSILLAPSFRYWQTLMRFTLSVISFWGWTSPVSLWERCFSLLIIFVALHWTCSVSSLSLLSWGAQNWTQHSRCGLTRSEWRGRITSLELLATLFLMNPRTPLAFLATRKYCWLMDSLLFTRTPRSYSTELLSSRSAPASAGDWGYSSPGKCRTLHLLLLNFRKFFSVHLFNLHLAILKRAKLRMCKGLYGGCAYWCKIIL